MALRDLAVHRRLSALRYASSAFDEFRLIFDDLETAGFDRQKVVRIARRARGRAISAKATVDEALRGAAKQPQSEATSNVP